MTRRGRELPKSKWMVRVMYALPVLPLVGIAFGWIFTESARQPWVVFGLMKTADGVSPQVSGGAAMFTLVSFTVLYGILAVIEFGLFFRAIRVGTEKPIEHKENDKPLAMAY